MENKRLNVALSDAQAEVVLLSAKIETLEGKLKEADTGKAASQKPPITVGDIPKNSTIDEHEPSGIDGIFRPMIDAIYKRASSKNPSLGIQTFLLRNRQINVEWTSADCESVQSDVIEIVIGLTRIYSGSFDTLRLVYRCRNITRRYTIPGTTIRKYANLEINDTVLLNGIN